MLHSHEDRAARLLARSLPLVRRHKDVLLEGLEAALRRDEGPDEAFGQAEVTAMLLTELLIAQATSLVRFGALGALSGTAAEHRALDIDGRHYSRFGDALAPVMKDVLGPTLPAAVPSAWCDIFWRVVEAARAAERTVPA